jgi:hypothetical protein
MMQMHRKTHFLKEVASMVITPITLGEERELENLGNTSNEEYDEQHNSE